MASNQFAFTPHDWQRIVECFLKWEESQPASPKLGYWRAMRRLATDMKKSGLADSIYGYSSLDRLRLSMTPAIRTGNGTLFIEMGSEIDRVRLIFEEHAFPTKAMGRENWSHEYPLDELQLAVGRFFIRASWFAKGHLALERFLQTAEGVE